MLTFVWKDSSINLLPDRVGKYSIILSILPVAFLVTTIEASLEP